MIFYPGYSSGMPVKHLHLYMADQTEEYFKANRELWDSRVEDHLQSDFYNVASFRQGKTTLNSIERNALGDVRGKKLLHLQCHFGLDTLSWEREGAEVTGVDFSTEAIAAAKKLADDCGLSGKFVCCSIYDLPQHLDGEYDIVFTSYGTIGWLPDLDRWAAVVNRFLKKGGLFYIADFHPVIWMLDDTLSALQYSYFNHELIVTESTGSYASGRDKEKRREYGWNHSLSELMSALLRQGLQIVSFEEYDYSPYNCFQGLVQEEDGVWRHASLGRRLPMVYGLKAVKP